MITQKSDKWFPLVGFEGAYEISPDAKIRKLSWVKYHPRSGETKKPARLVKQSVSNGYLCVALFMDGHKTFTSVHRLMARTFCPGYFEGAQVNHRDGNKRNNAPENLEWCTSKENSLHSTRVLLKNIGEDNKLSRLTSKTVREIRTDREKGMPLLELVAKYKTCIRNVSDIVKARSWRHVA